MEVICLSSSFDEKVEKSKSAKTLATKTWYLKKPIGCTAQLAWGGFSIDNQSTSWTSLFCIERESCWYQHKNGSMWTYKLIDYLRNHHCIGYKDLHFKNLYELHPIDEWMFILNYHFNYLDKLGWNPLTKFIRKEQLWAAN